VREKGRLGLFAAVAGVLKGQMVGDGGLHDAGEWREGVGGCATSVTIVAGETGGAATPTGAGVMVAAACWRGFVALREVKWAVFVDAASGDR
jgi:hypothetical protein